ncbi:MAG TPA: PEP-CTERM sorting domain-containing protein [Edaphobacter sp.]|nr:PEP-CTERM sorting domain-containing protein [Edaphobacter sp.]
MRSIDSIGPVRLSCFTLVLLCVSGQMIAEPLGRLQGNQAYTGWLRIADRTAVQRRPASDHTFGLGTPEVLGAGAVSDDSSARLQRVRFTSKYEDALTELTPEIGRAAPTTAKSHADTDADRVPESSTLFLLGLGLVGLAQLPVRKLAKKFADRRHSLIPGREELPPETEIPFAIQGNLPAAAENHIEA